MSEEPVRGRTDEALERAGLADMRPAYRRLLVALKSSDPAAFEEASRRYREEIEPAIAGGEVDPVATWLEYGIWLSCHITDGRPLAVDATGRARPFDPETDPDSAPMILYMPEDDRAPLLCPAALPATIRS